MLIKPFRKYLIIVKGSDQIIYRWYLKVEPWYKAWNVVNERIEVGKYFRGYLILTIDDVTNKSIGKKFDELKLWDTPRREVMSYATTVDFEDFSGYKNILELSVDSITEEEFYTNLKQNSIDFAVPPLYDQAYRCTLCGGVVFHNICTQCMFDWDS